MGITCNGTLTTDAKGAAQCSVDWIYEALPVLDLTPIITLTDMLDVLFTFDAELFGTVMSGSAILFSVGWGAGVVMRNLSRGS